MGGGGLYKEHFFCAFPCCSVQSMLSFVVRPPSLLILFIFFMHFSSTKIFFRVLSSLSALCELAWIFFIIEGWKLYKHTHNFSCLIFFSYTFKNSISGFSFSSTITINSSPTTASLFFLRSTILESQSCAHYPLYCISEKLFILLHFFPLLGWVLFFIH